MAKKKSSKKIKPKMKVKVIKVKSKSIKKQKKSPAKSISKHSSPIKKKGFFANLFGKDEKKQVPKKSIVHQVSKKKEDKSNKKAKKIIKVKKINEAKIKKQKIKELKLQKIKLLKEKKEHDKKEKLEQEKRKAEEKKRLELLKKQEIAKKKLDFMKDKGKIVKQEKSRAISQAIATPKKYSRRDYKPTFIKLGIKGFDDLAKDGVPEGAAILVEGGPGSGKTIFCLELAKRMCEKGKKVLYMSFEEPEYRLRSHLKSFGTDVEGFEKKNLLYIKRFNALDIARSVEALLSEAKKELLIDVQPVLIPHDFEPDIVLIDSLTSIGSAFSGEESRFRIYMEQLFRYLESHQITSFLIRETSNPTHLGHSFTEKAEAVSFLSDGIIAMYNVFVKQTGKRKRAMEIVKMRGVHIDRKIVECEIVKGKGLVIHADKVLTGNYDLT